MCDAEPGEAGEPRKKAGLGGKSARQIEFAMAGCDAKTGRTKSEFRDICQNKLAQLSVDVFSPLWRALAFPFWQQDKLVALLLHCFRAQYQSSEHGGVFRHVFQRVGALLSETCRFLNITVEIKRLPLTLAFTLAETVVLK